MRKLKNTVGYKLIARAIAQFIWNSSSLELLSDTYFSFEFEIDYWETFFSIKLGYIMIIDDNHSH